MKTHLVFAIMTALLLVFVIGQEKTASLTFDTVITQARWLSEEPYEPTPPIQSKALNALDYDQYRKILWRPEFNLWRENGLPFQAGFFITGYTHDKPVTIFQVNQDGAGPLRFSPTFFNFHDSGVTPEDATQGGYGGFRVLYPINKPDVLDEVFVFPDASYFRAVAKNQRYGISARGLAIDTLKKEEFPSFTTFWLRQPAPGANSITIYALLDGPSVTGAYEFVIRPGDETRMEVRAVIYPRRDLDGLGIAPLTSMFWFGENTSNTFGNFRPEVHDSDGLSLVRGNGEWIWRPLSWLKQLQVNVFEDTNPRGFGLMQRDRDFSHYQDLEANYHLRPSLWVEPVGNWGEGAVKLMQLPTDNEYMDNVVAWWQPKGIVRKGERLDLRYVLRWLNDDPGLPPIGRCLSTRIDYQDAPYYRIIVLDFGGGELANLPQDAPVQADLWIGDTGKITNVTVQKNSYDNTWRVSFVSSTDQLKKPIELRCALRLDGRTLSETWTYTWMQ